MRKWSAHWLFGILSYDHWDIKRYGFSVGMCVTNPVDRSVSWVRYQDTPENMEFPDMPFRQTLIWIERNQGESFPSRRT